MAVTATSAPSSGEADGDGASDAAHASGAGDDGDFAFEASGRCRSFVGEEDEVGGDADRSRREAMASSPELADSWISTVASRARHWPDSYVYQARRAPIGASAT